MAEKFTVQHSVDKDDQGGIHVLDCSCSCGGPNVTVINTHSAKPDDQTLLIRLRSEEDKKEG